MSSQFLKARQTKFASYAAVYTLIVLAIVTAANVLANRYDKSFDATANKRYSLSEQTLKIIKGLKSDATITYFDKTTSFQSAKDQLDLYANASHKIHIEYVDPDKEPRVARAAGVRTPGTAIVQIGLNKNEAKSLTEEGITGAIIRDLKNTTRTICFVTGSGEHRIDDSGADGYSRLQEVLGKDDYTAKSLDLLTKAEIDNDCTVLVVAGPDANYLQPEVDAIKKYVENGGRALFLLDPPLKMGREEVADNDDLDGVLGSWGVTPDKDLILDMNPISQVVGVGPEVALVTTYDSHPIVSPLKGNATGFPISRSLEVQDTASTTVAKLFSSSTASVSTAKLSSPNVDPGDPKNKRGPFVLAAAGTYKTGKENSQGRFVVVGSSVWAANRFLGFNGNRDLALNVMNWLSSDEDLISIRPKEPEDRRITMTRAQFNFVRITSQFILPLIVIFAGISVWWRRR